MVRIIEAVIFDMDGTLVDTERLGFTGWEEAGRELGVTVPSDLMRRFIGHNVAESIEMLMDELGLDREFATRLSDRHWEIRRERTATDLTMLPGAHEALDALRAAGYRLALCTASYRDITEFNLTRFGLMGKFESITCGDEVAHGKPDPEIYLTAASKLGVDPARCAMVEDSPNGVRSGFAAGMRPFMVPNVLTPTEEMYQKTEAVLDSLFDLPAAVEALEGLPCRPI